MPPSAVTFSGSSPFMPRRATLSSKHTTPELPVLEGAAAELLSLGEFGLLPAAAIDIGDREDVTSPSTAVPWSPAEIGDDAEASETDTCDGCDAYLLEPVPCAIPSEGGLVPMWCVLRNMKDSNVMIVPIADGWLEHVPRDIQAGHALMKLWCWAVPDENGTFIVTPCSDQAGIGPAPVGLAAALLTSDQVEENCFEDPEWTVSSPPTTLEVGGLPKGISQEDFIEILDREEASGLYDFVFLPTISALSEADTRFAVVNCISHDHARTLGERLLERKYWGVDAGYSECTVSWARVQGAEEMIAICRDCLDNLEDVEEAFRPQKFLKGFQAEMPRPTEEFIASCS